MSSINNSKLDDNYEFLEDLPRTNWSTILKSENTFQLELATGFGAGFSRKSPTFWGIFLAWGIWVTLYELLDSILIYKISFLDVIHFIASFFSGKEGGNYSFIVPTIPTIAVWIVGLLIFASLFYYFCFICDRAVKHFAVKNTDFIVLDKIWAFLFVLFVASMAWPINYTGYNGRLTYLTQVFSLGVIAHTILFLIFYYFVNLNLFAKRIKEMSSKSKFKLGLAIMLDDFMAAICTLIVWQIGAMTYLML